VKKSNPQRADGERLVQALQELRDTLVHASLLLHDLEFQMNFARRMEAVRDSSALIARIRKL